MPAFSLVRTISRAARSAGLSFSEHDQCLALSSVFLGKLCEQLVAKLPGRRVAAGQSIYVIGDRGQSIYFLRSGLVKTGIVSEDGREFILQVCKPGEIFGEFCFCEVGRLDQAVAIEPSEIVEIQFDDLVSHLRQNRQAMLDFLKVNGVRLAEAYEQLRILSVDRRMQRLVRTLLKLADQLGTPTSKGIQIAHHFKQEEVGEMIGTRREVVSGLLNQLRKMGLISYSRKHSITINKKRLDDYLRTLSSEPHSKRINK